MNDERRTVNVRRGRIHVVTEDDLLKTLIRFHREIVVPDIERIVDMKIAPLRNEMLANFDAVFKRLDRLESEYTALNAALHRVEDRLTVVDEKLDRFALRSEVIELKERVAILQRRIDELEKHII